MPRARHDEPSFSSDSFLDVVCNIVGILVILMVVVAARASKTPAAPAVTVAEPIPVPTEAMLPAADAPLVSRAIQNYSGILQPVESEFRPLPLPELTTPPELVREAAALSERSQALQAEIDRAARQLREVQTAAAQQVDQTAQMRQLLAMLEKELTQQRRQTQLTADEQAQQQQRIAALQQRIEALKQQQRPVELLKHQLPPIGKLVDGHEVHFRLKGNRVSVLPIEDLAAEVKHEMQRRKDILLARSYFRGTTRSVRGYSMEYILQMETMSAEEERKAGPGMKRVAVSGWIITPTTELIEETLSQAQMKDSRFLHDLLLHETRSTVTFWVYPDSFELHRELSELAHSAGYWVASRPLPEGVPIAGSPQGSKSLAQ